MNSNVGALVYGTIIIGALLAAESARRETYPETLGAVAVALLLYWLAHSYAAFTARRLEKAEAFSFAELVHTGMHELWVLGGAVVPLLLIVIWWAAGAHLTSAVSAATWASAAMVVLIELVVGLRAELSRRDLVMQTGFGVVLGLLILALRLLLLH